MPITPEQRQLISLVQKMTPDRPSACFPTSYGDTLQCIFVDNRDMTRMQVYSMLYPHVRFAVDVSHHKVGRTEAQTEVLNRINLTEPHPAIHSTVLAQTMLQKAGRLRDKPISQVRDHWYTSIIAPSPWHTSSLKGISPTNFMQFGRYIIDHPEASYQEAATHTYTAAMLAGSVFAFTPRFLHTDYDPTIVATTPEAHALSQKLRFNAVEAIFR